MENSIFYFLLFCLTWLGGGIVRALCGMGSSIVVVSLFSFTAISFQELIPATIFAETFVTAYCIWLFRTGINYRILLYLVLSSIPGAALGVYLLVLLPASYLKLALGFFLLIYALMQFRTYTLPAHHDMPLAACLAGASAGCIAAATSMCGLPVAIYVLCAGWRHEEALSTMGCYFLLCNIIILFFHADAGLMTSKVFLDTLISVPAGIFGIFITHRFIPSVPTWLFRRIMQSVLLFAALSCLATGYFSLE